MDRSVRTTLTNMWMIYEGDKILVVGSHWSGLAFPGGHVESGGNAP